MCVHVHMMTHSMNHYELQEQLMIIDFTMAGVLLPLCLCARSQPPSIGMRIGAVLKGTLDDPDPCTQPSMPSHTADAIV